MAITQDTEYNDYDYDDNDTDDDDEMENDYRNGNHMYGIYYGDNYDNNGTQEERSVVNILGIIFDFRYLFHSICICELLN